MAFFPCIYFEALQQTEYNLTSINQRCLSLCDKIKRAMERIDNRTYFHKLLYKMSYVVSGRGLRLIVENPATEPNYLITGQNYPPPAIVDKNRRLRGDVYKKPTAYWFWGCSPTYGESRTFIREEKTIMHSKSAPKAGLCSEERSMISPDYARNFICDFILGKEQENTIPTLF